MFENAEEVRNYTEWELWGKNFEYEIIEFCKLVCYTIFNNTLRSST